MRDYYSLFHLTKELQVLKDSILIECFTQERNVLTLQFYNGLEIETLQFSSEPSFEALFLRRNFAKARANFKNIFPELLGKKCSKVFLVESERIITFDFSDYELWFVLFGGSKTNAFVLDKYETILNSFLKPKEFENKRIQEILASKVPKKIKTVYEYLVQETHFSKEFSEFLCKEYKLDCDVELTNMSEFDRNSLFKQINKIVEKVKNTNKFYLYFYNHKYFISFINLSQIECIAEFNSISDAIFSCYIKSLRYKKFKERYSQLKKYLESEFEYLRKLIEETSRLENIEQNIKKYQIYADLLISQPNLNLKGLTEIEIIDTAGNSVKIPLKPELNLQKNAENYYNKVKKLRTNLLNSTKIDEMTKAKFERVKTAIDKLLKIQNYLEIESFEEEFSDLFEQIDKKEETKEIAVKFRRYEIDDGAIIFVGRNAKNNEELTFGFASPNDYWFHTRTVEGSHCVLKYSKGKEPPKHIIEKCAQIAAYFSKARNSDYVPVIYTQRKYIRKPKKAETGTVVVMREEVIFVEPKAPETLAKGAKN
ncbi:MAG: NFACT RNA binding domain-containing protein [Ignavibacteria bacterium]|nr:NFACT RNA binding domain-containing protein [Ignavibacteria bacterium]